MKYMIFNRYSIIYRILIPALIMVLLFTSLTFASDDPAKNGFSDGTGSPGASDGIADTAHSDGVDPADVPADTKDPAPAKKAAKPDPRRSFSHKITSRDIKKYGTYHGRNAKRIPIITYHQIVTDKEKKSRKYRRDPWTVSLSAFNRQMKYLKSKGYRTINCDEFYLWYTGRIKLPKRTVMITFDDGCKSAIEKSAPVLKRYGFKATYFIIGKPVHRGGSAKFISEKRVRQLRDLYPDLEFQSHTYDLHQRSAYRKSYSTFAKDAAAQKKIYGFDYIAYPYGNNSKQMIKAYKKSGLRMGFTFGIYGYATRNQNAFRIRRLAVKGGTSFSQFKKWCS